MKNNWLRYLSDKAFRDAVNELVPTLEDVSMAQMHKHDEEGREYTDSDLRDAIDEAVHCLAGVVLLDDEEAAAALPEYKEWLKLHPTGIDLNAGKEPKTIQ